MRIAESYAKSLHQSRQALEEELNMHKRKENKNNSFVSITEKDDFNAKNIQIKTETITVFVKDLLAKGSAGKNELVKIIQDMIIQLNDGFDFGQEPAEEWVKYLTLLMEGHGKNLINPYSDLLNYQIETFLDSSRNRADIDSIKILSELPDKAMKVIDSNDLPIMSKTLYVIAIGGTDTTFYNGLSKDEMNSFAKEIYGCELFDSFKEYNVEDIIPRGFAAKKDEAHNFITNIESLILHAYNLGIRNIAVIGNAKTYKPMDSYLKKKLKQLKDLNIIVSPQPLLPIIRVYDDTKKMVLSIENSGYPGGHGHGFKYCLRNKEIQRIIQENELEFFIFCNGDNAVILNWGADHFVWAIRKMQLLKDHSMFKDLRIAFFLVWEYLRKGGFAFLLTHKKTGEQITQIFEAEMAKQSGANIKGLEKERGGYNTNVATGIIKNICSHFDNLPMALKKKHIEGYTNFLFESSLATAITTHQNMDGSSVFDKNTAINVLGPTEAKYQHWNHIAIRKRDDLFAYYSSLFKTRKIITDFGVFSLIVTKRDATQTYPILKGNFVDPDILNTKEFFEVFKDAYLDVDEFHGIIEINLIEKEGKPQGRIKFEGRIKMIGTGKITATVPAGEFWIIKDKVIDSQEGFSISC